MGLEECGCVEEARKLSRCVMVCSLDGEAEPQSSQVRSAGRQQSLGSYDGLVAELSAFARSSCVSSLLDNDDVVVKHRNAREHRQLQVGVGLRWCLPRVTCNQSQVCG